MLDCFWSLLSYLPFFLSVTVPAPLLHERKKSILLDVSKSRKSRKTTAS